MIRVLLIEDSLDVMEAAAHWLENHGVEVTKALSLAGAHAIYEPDLFDVIVTDYELGDGTGIEFLASIRGTDKAKTVLWSGLSRDRELAAAGLHVDAFFTKDRLPEALDAVVSLASGDLERTP